MAQRGFTDEELRTNEVARKQRADRRSREDAERKRADDARKPAGGVLDGVKRLIVEFGKDLPEAVREPFSVTRKLNDDFRKRDNKRIDDAVEEATGDRQKK